MKIKLLALSTAVLSAISSTAPSFAAEATVSSLAVPSTSTGAETISTATIKQEAPGASLVDQLYAHLFTVYHGASLGDAGSSYTLDRTGKVNKLYSAYLDNTLTTAYLIDRESGIGIGPEVPFLLMQANGQHFILGDVGIKAFDKKTASIYGVNLSTNLIIQAPTSDSSRARHMSLAVKTTPSVRYAVPHSNFKIGSWTEAKAWFGVTKDRTFKLWAAPYVNYAFNDKFSLNVQYEMEARHYVSDRSFFDLTNYQTDLEPGVIVNITPHLMLNPYVQIFTGNKITVDNTAIGATLNATLL
jgi:hypothetical protein